MRIKSFLFKVILRFYNITEKLYSRYYNITYLYIKGNINCNTFTRTKNELSRLSLISFIYGFLRRGNFSTLRDSDKVSVYYILSCSDLTCEIPLSILLLFSLISFICH